MNTHRLPLIEELETNLSPIELFALFQNEPFCFFLDSAMDPQKLGRYSFLGANPFLLLKSSGTAVTLIQDSTETLMKGNPFDFLSQCFDKYRLDVKEAPVPFIGGAVGYLSYDLCHFIERLPARAIDDLQLPECYFGFYDLILAHDNLTGKTWVVSTGFPELEEIKREQRALIRLEELKRRFTVFTKYGQNKLPLIPKTGEVNLSCNFTHETYVQAVEKARRYIIDGDIFEVNLSQRFQANLSIHPYELYKSLRQINPAPFAAYLDFAEVVIASASPERFLRCQGDQVETRPIKGTIRRGNTPEEDRAYASQLLNSAKDHAENMMIVDLERNDLGRVCRYGTIKVTELAVLEKFPTVFHLTSTIIGQLKEGTNTIDLLKATFPGGSITGAPKVRSMEIIDELEPTRRSIYTGNVGYFSFNGNIDLNIVIRTFLIKDNRVYFQAGGAVVYDSDPEAEYQETLDKVRALMNALGVITEPE